LKKEVDMDSAIASDSAALRVEGITKSFGPGNVAVDGISFDARPGEFIVLLGPSGCGKTTTLRCVAGFERPDAGRIAVGGDIVDDPGAGAFVAPQRRNIGMVFQSYAIWPHMTVGKNVVFPLEVRGVDRRRRTEQMRSALDLVGLEGLESRPASQLSGGQQQRVALARALIYQPHLLLLDEPLSNLDAALRTRLRLELKKVQRQAGVTAVYVTHDQSEAVVLGDRVIVMSNGRIEQSSTPDEMYNRPATEFVASFTGTDNLLYGTLDRVDGSRGIVVTDDGLTVVGHMSGAIAPGARVCVAFRGEDMELRAAAGEADAAEGWRGTLTEALFLGLRTQYTVRVAEERLLAVMGGSVQRHEVGDPVDLLVSPDLVTILPAQSEASCARRPAEFRDPSGADEPDSAVGSDAAGVNRE